MSAAHLLRRTGEAIAPWAVPILLVVIWEVVVQTDLIAPRLLPAPSAVAVAFWENAKSGILFHHMAVSAGRALQGLVIGGCIGFVLGVVNGISRPAETLLDSSLQMLRNVPHLA